MKCIGTCSLCGGEVCTPDVWAGIMPPTPTCNRCGAVAASSGPIIPMRRVDSGGKAWTSSGIPEISYKPHKMMDTWGKQ